MLSSGIFKTVSTPSSLNNGLDDTCFLWARSRHGEDFSHRKELVCLFVAHIPETHKTCTSPWKRYFHHHLASIQAADNFDPFQIYEKIDIAKRHRVISWQPALTTPSPFNCISRVTAATHLLERQKLGIHFASVGTVRGTSVRCSSDASMRRDSRSQAEKQERSKKRFI